MNFFFNLFRKNSHSSHNICQSEEDFQKKLTIEQKRSEYNDQEFSLILLNVNSSPRHKVNKLIKEIHSRIRTIDIIGKYDQECIGVIMPYTSENGAKGFLNKIADSISGQHASKLEISLYRYNPGSEKPELIQLQQS